MLFNSGTFVVFFAIVVALHRAPLSWTTRKFNLLVASYLFYAAWNPPLIVLLWLSTLIDWFVGKRIAATERLGPRRLLLGLSLVINLGLLGFFKYGGFVLTNFVELAHRVGLEFNPAKPDIILPMGISFYTFQTLTYTFDIYRRQLKPSRSFLDYALYVTFFPQLVAGPIVRASDFLPQCKTPESVSGRQFSWGLYLLTLGLFQKIVLADGFLSKPADAVFNATDPVPILDSWLGVLAFSGQIFFDFAGYSTCAIGTALCLGFHLPTNFRFPYAALGFSDFWRRWHITLSTWLRDYLYIPLGGSRGGRLATHRNIAITMLLGGLWHGASWTFVVWGGLHSLYLSIERMLRDRFPDPRWLRNRAGEGLLVALTFLFVNLTWVFFRAQDFPTAWALLLSLFGLIEHGPPVLSILDLLAVGPITLSLLLAHWRLRHTTFEEWVERTPTRVISVLWTVMILAIVLMQGGGDAFIYFQF